MIRTKIIWTLIAVVAIGGLLSLPRVTALTNHWSSDESTWLLRSHGFAAALQRHDFTNTLQSYHPGVTTMWLGGAVLWHDYGSGLYAAPFVTNRKLLSPEQLARARLPIALTISLTILLAGLLLRRLLGNTMAFVGTLFLAIDPFFLAESRRLHTDALATGFLMLTLLCWLCYLEGKRPCRRDLILSGISFGLACLSKSLVGGFLLFLPLLLTWYGKQRNLSALRLLWGTFLWGAIVMLTILILWPYMWTWQLGQVPMFPPLVAGAITIAIVAARQHERESTITWSRRTLGGVILASLGLVVIVAFSLDAARQVLERIYWALTTPHEEPQLFLKQISHAQGVLYYPVYWFVWSAPLTAPLIAFACWQLWRQRHVQPRAFRVGVVLILLGVFYLWGLTLVAKKIARYLVISFPVWDVLAAIGVVLLVHFLRTYITKPSVVYAALVGVLLVQVVPVLKLHPNYRAYHHPLLSGDWIAKNTSLGGGTGLDLAAAYLNEKPDAERMTVRVTRLGEFLKYYFVGQMYSTDNVSTHWWPDYDVVYIRDKQVYRLPEDLPRRLEHVVRLNGIDYVWIYRVLQPAQL